MARLFCLQNLFLTSMRTKVPAEVETELLLRSARRCCICLGLRFDADEKAGQVAHLDGDRQNHSLGNLAWLCLYHHDSYDGRTSQSKGLTIGEVKAHRARLCEMVEVRGQSSSSDAKSSIRSDRHNEEVLKVVQRYHSISDDQIDALNREILTRVQKIFSFCNSLVREYDRLNDRSLEASDYEYDWAYNHLKEQFDIPDGVYGLNAEGEVPEEWLRDVSELVEDWTNGWLKFDECIDLMCELDERYDFDLQYMLYGIPNAKLNAVTYQLLMSMVYEFGMRNMRDKDDLQE